MDFSYKYSDYRFVDQTEPHFLASNSPDTDLVDPALESWCPSTSGWPSHKQPMHRFLSEHDQGPMLFQATQTQEPFGVPPVPGSYRRLSPPRTTISSTDSCASPPCATDFPQPHSPEMTDCVSPPIGYPESMMGGCATGYMSCPGSYINPFDFGRRPDGSAVFDLAETTLDCTPSPDSLPTPSSWPLSLDRSYKVEFDTNHFSEHMSLDLSPRHIEEVTSDGEDCLVVNTQPLPQDNQKNSRRQKTSTSYQADDQHVPPRKRKSEAQAVPCKRQKTRPIAVEPSSPPTMDVPRTMNSFACHDCEKPCRFKDEQTLIKHRKAQHTRPFSCVYHFAGCQSTFASKNEWKRHVLSQHLVLYYWICTEGSCAQVPISSSSSSYAEDVRGHASQSSTAADTGGSDVYGTVFNRKDLYTQHLRRMHVPTEYKKVAKQKNAHHGEWEKQVKEHQKNAQRTRCTLPDQMDCPQAGCTTSFHGKDAWDDRMEHVARHLDATGNASDLQHSGGGPALEFGGSKDRTLLDWSMSADVNVIRWNMQSRRWELNNPLRTSAGPRKPSTSGRTRRCSGNEVKHVMHTAVNDDEDEDAEGEDDDVYVN